MADGISIIDGLDARLPASKCTFRYHGVTIQKNLKLIDEIELMVELIYITTS